MRITRRQLRRIIKEAVEASPHAKRDKLLTALQDAFDFSFIRTTEEFDGRPGGIWTSAEHGDVAPDGNPLFDYYGNNYELYEMGVHKKLADFLDSHGFYAEFYDPGTVMIGEI
tara:strand:- start:128 stop:466 length:339 start_codon:yes stop_codon:yes gene_type:complete